MTRPKYIDMYKDFLTLVKKSRVGTVIPEEFVRLLNLAIEEVVSQRVAVLELNKKVTDDLLPLKVSQKDLILVNDGTDPFGGYITSASIGISGSYRRIAAVRVDLVKSGLPATKKNVKCYFLSSFEASEVLDGYYSRPSLLKCYYTPVLSSNQHKIRVYIPAGYVASKCSCDLYVNPTLVLLSDVTNLSNQCQFNVEVSNAIVNVAARMCIESNADSRYQSFMNEQQIKSNN